MLYKLPNNGAGTKENVLQILLQIEMLLCTSNA